MADSGSALKDIGAAVLVVAVVMGGLFLYTQNWPPMVVVESGSMMHVTQTGLEAPGSPYGLLGTIDPGDMVLVRKVETKDDICTQKTARPDCQDDEHYSGKGDVVIYYRAANKAQTPIIHRAIAWVEVRRTGSETSYDVEGYGKFGPQGIYIPEIGFDEGRGFTPERGYQPSWSGYLTKGDNAATNADADQAGGISPEPVQLLWISDGGGVARGELPWFGLIKLAVADKENNHDVRWTKIGNAWAPKDLWVMLVISLVGLVLLPVVIERGIYFARERIEASKRAKETEPRGSGEPPK